MSKKRPNPHRGSSLDAFLEEEELLDDAIDRAIKMVVAWQLAKSTEETGV